MMDLVLVHQALHFCNLVIRVHEIGERGHDGSDVRNLFVLFNNNCSLRILAYLIRGVSGTLDLCILIIWISGCSPYLYASSSSAVLLPALSTMLYFGREKQGRRVSGRYLAMEK